MLDTCSSREDHVDEESMIPPQEVWERLSEEEKDSLRKTMIHMAEDVSRDYFEDASKS
jgi:hypothetical protein